MPLSVRIVSPTSTSVISGPAPMIAPTATVESTHPVSTVKFYAGSSTIGETPPTISSYHLIASGVVSLTLVSPTVNGTGTSFLTDFSVGDFVIFSSQPTSIYRIDSIASNILMTLTTNYTGASVSIVTVRSVTIHPYYSVAWLDVAPGTYVLRAVVTDITGATATSDTVEIRVSGVITGLPSTGITGGSSLGFGRGSFGQHQFGFGDWAEEMLWGNLPQVYKDCDESGPNGSAVQQPLRKFQNALKPSYQELRIRWHEFPYLWDAIRVPLDQLPQLGYNVGITVDSTKTEGLQRSSVLNASQLWINKGNDKGYRLTAAFEGLLVTITPLWAETCGPSNYTLANIGAVDNFYDLSSAPLPYTPVSPGTLHIKVTTSYGIVEDIYDDEAAGIYGVGNQQNGPLTRVEITRAVSLFLTSISGLFFVGDTITQGPTTGVVVASVGAHVTVQPTFGSFIPGAILDTTTLATATVTSTSSNTLQAGETIEGLTSGTTAVLRDFRSSYAVVDRITTLAGFSVGETLRGQTSGLHCIAGASTALVPGPLRAKIDLTATVGTFAVDDQVTGVTSGAVGIVREVSGSTIYVDTITQPGFLVGETIFYGPSSGTVSSLSFGEIDYLVGGMLGHTVSLLAGSTVNSVVDLQDTGPTQFLPNYDSVAADDIPMDLVESDRYAKWPITYHPVRIAGGILTPGECRSYSLRLYFYTPDDTEIENFEDVANRIMLDLERFRPIHVRFDKVSFDGSRASSQVWRTGAIAAEAAAAAVWTAPVVANQVASSQVWTTGPITATVAT